MRRVAGGLLAAGIRREERVLLLMHDCCDWPVAFLGAIYAGVVPVAVNTLLPADDYHYMLKHSRRDMRSHYELLDKLDLEALRAQRRLTIPFVRDVMSRLALSEE